MDNTNGPSCTFAFAAYCHKDDKGSSTPKRKKRRFPCWSCKKMFAQKVTLNDHIARFHTSLKPYSCPECSKSFSLQRDYNQHIIKHRNHNAFKCQICEKTYSNPDKLKEHMLVHEPSKVQFQCPHCGKCFIKQAFYLKHLESHSTIFTCTECPKTLKSKYTLDVHMLKHKEPPKHACQLCDRKYYTKHRLQNHVLVKHKNIRSRPANRQHATEIFKCTECPKVLKSKYTLKNHILKHKEPPKHACQFCNLKYYTTYRLQSHVKAKHQSVQYITNNEPRIPIESITQTAPGAHKNNAISTRFMETGYATQIFCT